MEPTVLVVNSCSVKKIADIFWPIIHDAIAAYQSIFGASVLSIRLMGSVARGEAGSHSDVDLIALLNTSPNQEQMCRVEEFEKELRHSYPFVPRVDLEAVSVEGLAEFRQFVFATDSIILFGSDTYTSECQRWDRRQLADLITPDLASIVLSYRSAMETANEENHQLLHFYSRLIGKDVLKCFRRIALLRGGQYERSIDGIYRQLLSYAPEHKEILAELYRLYVHPCDDRRRLLDTLHRVEASRSITDLI